ncbi:MAG: tRNA 2-thiouridine(34) synthase MnmA [Spirochaetaceae bacterium]
MRKDRSTQPTFPPFSSLPSINRLFAGDDDHTLSHVPLYNINHVLAKANHDRDAGTDLRLIPEARAMHLRHSMKTAALLSGGVDSSVALARALESGAQGVTAFYLKVWLEDELDGLGTCPWEEDLAYARRVCEQLEVPLKVVPLQLEYYDRVVSYTLSELRAGRTPSPDIFCNQRIKFGAFYEYLGDEYQRIVTGHYARTERGAAEVLLKRGVDPVKDQTYFLSHLTQSRLARAWFPIGGIRKTEVRSYARRLELPNQNRPDSQGICFLGKVRYPEFIRHYLGEQEGHIVERESGRLLGTHRGYWFYTIGQRQGLGLGGGPWYVVDKDTADNTIFVSHANNVVPTAARRSLRLGRLHWIGTPPARERLFIRIRHGPELVPCTVKPVPAADAEVLEVEMERADRGVAPGQFGVLYDDEVCLGAGMIL